MSRCQHAFLNNIELGDNIARNTALSENVFMMAICTELRIPLFVVGKPGSSKSLAKDVISTHMKGGASQSELFQNLKQVRAISLAVSIRASRQLKGVFVVFCFHFVFYDNAFRSVPKVFNFNLTNARQFYSG